MSGSASAIASGEVSDGVTLHVGAHSAKPLEKPARQSSIGNLWPSCIARSTASPPPVSSHNSFCIIPHHHRVSFFAPKGGRAAQYGRSLYCRFGTSVTLVRPCIWRCYNSISGIPNNFVSPWETGNRKRGWRSTTVYCTGKGSKDPLTYIVPYIGVQKG